MENKYNNLKLVINEENNKVDEKRKHAATS
jgi:hypothetical protein